jgi:hypothetical protein
MSSGVIKIADNLGNIQERFFIYVPALPQAGHAVLPYGYITQNANK